MEREAEGGGDGPLTQIPGSAPAVAHHLHVLESTTAPIPTKRKNRHISAMIVCRRSLLTYADFYHI